MKNRCVICHAHGCQRTSLPGKHFCNVHLDQEDSFAKRKPAVRKQSRQWHNLYDTARWRRTSKEFLTKYPICCRCGAQAKIADHIKPHRGDIEVFYDEYNLQPLCWKCHSAKTLKENNYFKERRNGND